MEKIIDIIIKCILTHVSSKLAGKINEKLICYKETKQKKYNDKKEAIKAVYNCLINAIDSIAYKPEKANYYLCITEDHYFEIKKIMDKFYLYLNNRNAKICDNIMKLYLRNVSVDVPTVNMVYPDDSFLPAFNEKDLKKINYYTKKIINNFRKELNY